MTLSAFAGFLQAVMPVAAVAAMGILLCVFLLRYFAEPLYHYTTFPQLIQVLKGHQVAVRRPYPPERLASLTPLKWLAAMFLLSRALIYAVAMAGAAIDGEFASFIANPSWYFTRWDAHHYIGLAENWYVNVGDARFHIVFYPLYPLIVRIFLPLFGGNGELAGYFVSAVCLFFAGWLLYLLVRIEYGDEAARRAVRYLMFNPLSFFLTMPYSESLFLLLTIAAVLLARRRHMLPALLVGALASATRMLGLLIAVPIYLEFLRIARERSGGNRKQYIARMALYALFTCTVALGFAAYLLLNKQVTGDPFQFLIYQREHWSQQFGSLYHTVSTTLSYLFRADIELGFKLGVWIPQAISIFLMILLLAVVAHKVRPGDGAYALLYTYVALAPTWLLSGPRYLMALYALYPMLTLITRRKWQDRAMMTGMILTGFYSVYVFVILGTMY